MKRRIIVLLVTAMFTMGLFTGCGANEQSMTNATTAESETTSNVTDTTLPQDGLSEAVNSEENTESIISEEEVKKIALKEAGIKESDVKDIRVRLETDDRVKIYEGSIVSNNIEYDFEINAKTGAILEWESESVYDD